MTLDTTTNSLIISIQHIIPIFITFVPFSIFNIYGNYRSSLYVTTSTLNIPRAEMIFHNLLTNQFQFHNHNHHDHQSTITTSSTRNLVVSSPEEISYKETFIRKYKSPFSIPLLIEPALHHYTSEKYSFNIFLALNQNGFIHSEEYFIMNVPHQKYNKQHLLILWFSQNSKPTDMIKGLYHVCALRYYLDNN